MKARVFNRVRWNSCSEQRRFAQSQKMRTLSQHFFRTSPSSRRMPAKMPIVHTLADDNLTLCGGRRLISCKNPLLRRGCKQKCSITHTLADHIQHYSAHAVCFVTEYWYP